jgi:hypothetical protein
MMLDTGICVPESAETLKIQQSQLTNGKRAVQMFPIGTAELEIPAGFKRHENMRGVFHYNPNICKPDMIDLLSLNGNENVFLNLGPYSKVDIARRAAAGEKPTCVMETTPEGVEVRCAAATSGTVMEQKAYFERTKEPGNKITIGILPDRITAHLAEGRT